MRSWRKARQRRVRAEQNRDPIWHWHRGPVRDRYTLGHISPGSWNRVEAVFVRWRLTRSKVEPEL